MTADLDLSSEAVERLATMLDRASGSAVLRSVYLDTRDAEWCAAQAASTIRALSAENDRLRAEDKASAHDIARLKESETHWLNEAERLRAERDAAWQAGAVAMRERAAYKVAKSGAIVDHPSVFMGGPSRNAIRIAGAFAAAIRALPLPGQPTNNEENT